MDFQDLMNAFSINEVLSNQATYNALLAQLKMDRMTPVIGAGLSVWADYPLWGKLLTDKAKGTPVEKKVKALLEQGQYEQAAGALEAFYGKNAFRDALRKTYDPNMICEEKRPPYQRLIGRLFRGPVVTTNFDVSLERLLNIMQPFTAENVFHEGELNRRLQNNKPALIKLHGTVEDPEHMILTEDYYNKTYGDDPDAPEFSLPLPNALRTIFHAAPPLFLGCSLDEDRTCKVLRACKGNIGYALLPLPKETENKGNPFAPILTDDEGWIPAFQKRRDWLDDMGVRVIWYPYGKYEAVDVLIEKLASDMGISDDPDPPSEREVNEIVQYKVTKNFIGRDAQVNRIVDALNNADVPLILVHGPAGIGKTEICKAAYQAIKRANPAFTMPMVDLVGVRSLDALLCRLAEGLGFSMNNLPSDRLLPTLLTRVCALCKSGQPILYLDNFEDVWPDSRLAQNELLSALQNLTDAGLRLLVSSQENLPMDDLLPVEVDELDSGVAIDSHDWAKFSALSRVRLFIDTLKRQPRPDERDALIQLTAEMDGHPLSIVLTATYGRECGSLNELLTVWHSVDIPISRNQNGRHSSLSKAFALTWSRVREDRAASLRWALHALSLYPLDDLTLRELRDFIPVPFTDEAWLEGRRLLRRLGLIDFDENGRERMLLAVKKTFLQLDGAQPIGHDALLTWVAWGNELLKKDIDRAHADYLPRHQRAVHWLPQCWNLAEHCLEGKDYDALEILLRYAGNLYQFDTSGALPLLQKIVGAIPEDHGLRAQFTKRLGDLFARTGRLEDALKAYDEAEALYRDERANLGRANVLQSRGDLLRRTGRLEDALKAYDEAEALYRDERVDLGRANVLQSRGDLLQGQGDWSGASVCYEQAIPLYRQEQDAMGLCYTLSELLFCKERLGDARAAAQCLSEIETLLPNQPEPVRRYVESKIREAQRPTPD